MRAAPARTITLLAALMLAACASIPRSQAGSPLPWETITVAVGPCFGFCPVYTASVTPDGLIQFNGQRHTAVLGQETRKIDKAAYRTLVQDLAAFRPATGTDVEVSCSAAVSDTSALKVVWADAAGRNTVATVQSGCQGGAGRALVELLRGLPDRLGIADLAKQTTRPGASRG